jgi:thermolysin
MVPNVRHVLLCLILVCLAWAEPRPLVAQQARLARVAPGSLTELRAWDARVDAMLNTGELRVRITRDDTLMQGRSHQRADQFHRGVRVWGADVSRQLAGGQTMSVFGVLYDGIDIGTAPALSAADAKATIERIAGAQLGEARVPELVVLPIENGTRYALAYTERVLSRRGLRVYFVDARTGALLLEFDDLKTQASAVGRGFGVLGDEKKISTRTDAGAFQTWDELRPPDVRTYDMKGNLALTEAFLNGQAPLPFSELGRDSDNNWSDGAVVDAHVYSGWTYDYFFKRHNRRGLDNNNIRIASLTHPVRRQDIFSQPDEIVFQYYVNAFYAGGGILVYGEGLPAGVTLGGATIDFLAGGLDVVAHELTHGVTEFSSNLIYLNESGALNEAISDIMGTSVEFFFQPVGSGQRQADYQIGEDVWRPTGLRSMSNPASLGDPDHYSRRFLGPEDNGGVHINCGIPNQAFYLAIEGGTNRTSGLAVTGVGATNREQIEKVFYRAFTQMLPANANFSTARAATIQAARDLYGAGGAVERAVTQAWTAVGVN